MYDEQSFSAAITLRGLSCMNACQPALWRKRVFNDIGTGSFIVPDSYINHAIWNLDGFLDGIV